MSNARIAAVFAAGLTFVALLVAAGLVGRSTAASPTPPPLTAQDALVSRGEREIRSLVLDHGDRIAFFQKNAVVISYTVRLNDRHPAFRVTVAFRHRPTGGWSLVGAQGD